MSGKNEKALRHVAKHVEAGEQRSAILLTDGLSKTQARRVTNFIAHTPLARITPRKYRRAIVVNAR